MPIVSLEENMRRNTKLSGSALGLTLALLATGAAAEPMLSLSGALASMHGEMKAASARMKEMSAGCRLHHP
jgi:hypothetical protein